jgi:hypothetical protein
LANSANACEQKWAVPSGDVRDWQTSPQMGEHEQLSCSEHGQQAVPAAFSIFTSPSTAMGYTFGQ